MTDGLRHRRGAEPAETVQHIHSVPDVDESSSLASAAEAPRASASEPPPPMSSDGADGSAAFECNICFEQATEPVISLCGHLYCWPCLSQWMDSRQTPLCPVCKAGIGKDKVVPIFTRGGDNKDPRKKPASPRPQAQRPAAEPQANVRRAPLCMAR